MEKKWWILSIILACIIVAAFALFPNSPILGNPPGEENAIENCTQNWIEVNTSCIEGNITTWYNDTNSCNNETGIPGNITSNCTVEEESEENDTENETDENITECNQNWTAVNTSCIGGNITTWFNDTNSCNNETGIPGNITSNCTNEGDNTIANDTINCSPAWVAVNTSCISNHITTWYNDTNGCNNTSTIPTNITYSCTNITEDNVTKIIGSTSTIETNLNLTIKINSSPLNVSENYTSNQKVEFKDGNTTRLNFTYDFSSPLDLSSIEIEKQSSSSKSGSLIVKGLEINKTLVIDRINQSNKVCVKDSSINSISEISKYCNKTDEALVPCPGTKGNYSCSISGDKYIVYGLQHSAIIEYITPSTSPAEDENDTFPCIVNWQCGEWSPCANSQQTRSCIDINDCNSTASKPLESQTCTISSTPSCTPVWQCTNWTSCSKYENSSLGGIQNRNCTDTSQCPQVYGSPSLTKECEYKSSSGSWLLITIIVVIVIAILGGAFYFMRKRALAITPVNPINNLK